MQKLHYKKYRQLFPAQIIKIKSFQCRCIGKIKVKFHSILVKVLPSNEKPQRQAPGPYHVFYASCKHKHHLQMILTTTTRIPESVCPHINNRMVQVNCLHPTLSQLPSTAGLHPFSAQHCE